MNLSPVYRFRAAVRRRLSGASGAIDLASILVGVIVVGVIAGVVAATVFAVIPWTQDAAARENLRAVQTAQSVAFVKEGRYLNVSDLVAAGYLPSGGTVSASGPRGGGMAVGPAGLDVLVDSSGTCWVASSESASGRVFATVTGTPDIVELADLALLGVPSSCMPAAVTMAGAGFSAFWVIPDPVVEAEVRRQLGFSASKQLMLSHAPSLQYLKVSGKSRTVGGGVTSLEGLQYAANLEWVSLSNNTGLSDLSPLAGLPKLRQITAADTGVSDLASVATLPALQYLDVGYSNVTSLAQLASMTSLVWLVAPDLGLTELPVFSSRLTTLYLNNSNITDLSPLTNQSKLERLILLGVKLSDLSPLSGLSNLKYLHIGGTLVTDRSPVAHVAEVFPAP